MAYGPKKRKIFDCYLKTKLKHFQQAKLSDVYKCSGMKLQDFVNLIWEMWQKDQSVYCVAGRYSPVSIMRVKSGPLMWRKIDIQIAEGIRSKAVIKDPRYMSWPRYLSVRAKVLKGYQY